MRDILTVLFKHKKKILAVFLTVSGLICGGTLLLTPVYEAKASLLVKLWKDDSSRIKVGENSNSGNNAYVTLSQEELANTEIQVLTSKELAEKVIRAMTLARIYPDLARNEGGHPNPMALAVDTFTQNLKVMGVRKSNVITVTFHHSDPKVAAQAVNVLIDAFKEKHLALHSDPQSSFVGTQLQSFQDKLKETERTLKEYQQKNGVYSLEEQRTLLLQQRVDLDTSYKATRNNVSELKNKIAVLRGQKNYLAQNSARYTNTERDRIVVDAQSKLLELQLREQELRRKYTANNRLVVDARREIEMVNQFLREQERGIAGKVKTSNPVYQNVEIELFRAEGELNAAVAKAAALGTQLKQVDAEISQLDLSENRVRSLKREIEINEKNYKAYADMNEEARVAEAMNRLKLSNVSVIQPATVPTAPIKPNYRMNLLLGLLLGLVLSLTIAYISESMSQTFTDPESVERYLALPVLLSIPDKED